MKQAIQTRPLLTSFMVFLLLFVVGSGAGLAAGFWIVSTTHCEKPDDPCDGPAMAAVFMWELSIIASLVAGIIGGLLAYLLIWLTKRSNPVN